jgi:hypothetical protein
MVQNCEESDAGFDYKHFFLAFNNVIISLASRILSIARKHYHSTQYIMDDTNSTIA